MYIYIYIYIYVCMYICIHIHIYIHMLWFVYKPLNHSIHIYIYIYIYICVGHILSIQALYTYIYRCHIYVFSFHLTIFRHCIICIYVFGHIVSYHPTSLAVVYYKPWAILSVLLGSNIVMNNCIVTYIWMHFHGNIPIPHNNVAALKG